VINSHGRFGWYELITTNVEAAKAFYTRVMGWDVRDASTPGRTYILFSAEEALVSGLMDLPASASKTGGTPFWIGYVGVDDVDTAADRIKRLGGALHIPPTDIPNVGRFSVFADPQKATLALLKPLSPAHEMFAAMDAPGRIGWHELFAADWEEAMAFHGELFGWQKADSHMGEMGTYQQFSAGGQTIGGMLTKPPVMPAASWLYYFNVDNIDTAAQRVRAGGGQILDGPLEVRGGSWIVQCTDPQGAMFALKGKRGHSATGYFERAASRDSPGVRGRRWFW
jgi:predicted enzyme related to lactoylglutathione lyase